MKKLTVHVHQVGFIPLYLPFYVALSRVAKKLNWNVKYHVGTSDEYDIKRACRFKFKDKDNIHIVLTALHNLKVVAEEKPDTREKIVCEECNHKEENDCDGVFKDIFWYFPWIFVIKLPVYVFIKGKVNSKELQAEIDKVGVRYQLNWEILKKMLYEGYVKKIYIYPKGATINDVVLNHVFKGKINFKVEEINFDTEAQDKKDKIDPEDEPVLVFTLNPHFYEKDSNYKLVMKPPHNFFPFTGVAIPVIKDKGVTTDEINLLYHLEKEYVDFMMFLQENISPFFEKEGREEKKEYAEKLQEEIERILRKEINRYPVYERDDYTWKDCETNRNCRDLQNIDIVNFCRSFFDLYNDGVFREHTEGIVRDYLKEKTSMDITLFDPVIYKARVKDATAYIFARNLSHIYGSNVIPYVISSLRRDESDTEEIRKLLEFLQERMDYIATIISDESMSPYSFTDYKLEADVLFSKYKDYPFKYLFASVRPTVELEIKQNSSFSIGVPPILYEQAFDSIFENILRNAAKYGNYYEKLRFEVALDKDSDTNFARIIIKDRNVRLKLKELDKFKKQLKDLLDISDESTSTIIDVLFDEQLYEDLKDDEEVIKELLEKLEENEKILMEGLSPNHIEEVLRSIVKNEEAKKLIDELIKEENKLRQKVAKELNTKLNKAIVNPYMEINYESWGLKEVKISTAYLRGIPLEEIDLQYKGPSIIEVQPSKKGIDFIFYLHSFEKACILKKTEEIEHELGIPCEFVIVDEDIKNVKTLMERKYTRIFIGKAEIKDWKYWKDLWIEKLSNQQTIYPYFISDPENYKEFYYNHEKILEEDNKIIIAYIRHLKDIGREKFYELLTKIKEKNPYNYIHALKGGEFIYSLVRAASEKNDEFIKYKLLEAALLRILILDERIQDKTRDYENIELKNLNIYIPEIPLIKAVEDRGAFTELQKELVNINNIYKPHIVVVHVSLLEQSDKHLGQDFFMEEIIRRLEKNADIILTTGRGKITSKYRDIYGDAVPISHILKVFKKTYINKYILANTLIGFNRNILLNKYKKKVEV